MSSVEHVEDFGWSILQDIFKNIKNVLSSTENM